MDAPATWTYRGAAISSAPVLTVGAGWNLVGVAASGSVPTTASTTCDQLNATQDGAAVEVNRWVNGGWEGHRCGLPPNDFTFMVGQGYFVRAVRSAAWAPVGEAAAVSASTRR
jgi:hypothetical protein